MPASGFQISEADLLLTTTPPSSLKYWLTLNYRDPINCYKELMKKNSTCITEIHKLSRVFSVRQYTNIYCHVHCIVYFNVYYRQKGGHLYWQEVGDNESSLGPNSCLLKCQTSYSFIYILFNNSNETLQMFESSLFSVKHSKNCIYKSQENELIERWDLRHEDTLSYILALCDSTVEWYWHKQYKRSKQETVNLSNSNSSEVHCLQRVLCLTSLKSQYIVPLKAYIYK